MSYKIVIVRNIEASDYNVIHELVEITEKQCDALMNAKSKVVLVTKPKNKVSQRLSNKVKKAKKAVRCICGHPKGDHTKIGVCLKVDKKKGLYCPCSHWIPK